MKESFSDKYKEILDYAYSGPTSHPHMSMSQRAAQFLPFAALSGYDEAISESARLTDSRILLDDSVKEEINRTLQELCDDIPCSPEAVAVYFLQDSSKIGGAYIHTSGVVKKIDLYNKKLIFKNGPEIPVEDLIQLTYIKNRQQST